MKKEIYNCFWIKKGWGMVIYPFICYGDKKEDITEDLRAHEMEHIAHIREEGYFKWHWNYFRLFLKHGYKDHPYEKRAYKVQNEYIERHRH